VGLGRHQSGSITMRDTRWVGLVLLVSLLIGSAPEQENVQVVSEAELKKLEGTWRIVSSKHQDAEIPGSRSVRVEIEGNQFIFKSTEDSHPLTITRLDPGTRPKSVDLTLKYKSFSNVNKGIYKLEGDTLTLAIPSQGGERPTDFTTGTGIGTTVFVYQRER
jgi:uncharacterized protein (TIGR03067 family)